MNILPGLTPISSIFFSVTAFNASRVSKPSLINLLEYCSRFAFWSQLETSLYGSGVDDDGEGGDGGDDDDVDVGVDDDDEDALWLEDAFQNI